MEKRLVITQVVAENFKSFYGVQVIGPFNLKFTSVVGPNGSGKSNLIDALLFVFGYRANRLRQGKIQDLIHKSALHPNLSSAKVEVVFAQAHENEEIPGSRFSISRRVELSGSNDYYHNDTRATFTEITNLLRGYGVDLDHSRFLILQGEVELISQMKPKSTNQRQDGLLEFLEDIIGSNKYIEDIEDAEKRRDISDTERQLALDRTNMAKKERDEIKEAKEEAVTYLRLKEQVKKLDARALFANRQKIEELIDQKNKEVSTMNEKIEFKTKKLQGIEQEFDEGSNGKKKYENELAASKKEFANEQKNMSSSKSKKTKLKMDINHLQSIVKKASEDQAKANDTIKAMECNIKTKEENIILQENEKALKENELDLQRQKLEDLIASAKNEALKENESLLKFQADLRSEDDEYLKLKTQVVSASDEITALKQQENNHIMNLEKTKRTLEELRVKYQKLTKELEDSQNELSNSSLEEKQLLEDYSKTQNEYSIVFDQKRKAGKDLADAQRLVRNQTNNSRALDAVLSLHLPGVYGKLGKLGEIDRELNTAITMAAGNKLNNIVVDNMDTAKMCLAEIKRLRLERVTFIILDRVANPNPNPDIPQNARRLIDQIRFKDPIFLPAFYYAIKETLLANDFEEAKYFAYSCGERHRVVTIDGRVIEIAGTMSGGGLRTRTGGMDLVTEKEMEDLQKQSNEIDEAARVLKNRIDEMRNKLSTYKISNLSTRVEKLKMDVDNAYQQIQNFERQLIAIENEDIIDHSSRINELQAIIEEKTPLLQQLEQTVHDHQVKIKEIESKIKNISDEKTGHQVKVVQNLEKLIQAKTNEIIKNTSTIESAKRMINNSTRNRNELQQEIDLNQKEIEQKEIKLVEVKSERKEIKKRYQVLSQKVSENEENLKTFIENASLYRTKRTNLRIKIDGLKIYYESATKALKDLQRQYEYYTAKLERSGVSPEEFAEENNSLEAIEIEKAKLQERIGKIDPNLSAIQEYEARDAVYREALRVFSNETEKRDNIIRELISIKNERMKMFLESFIEIQKQLQITYQQLTLGGSAELEIIDSIDPFGKGIIYKVRPPSKPWKEISNLSGGEKTLSSLALIFALHEFKPTPFYIMDEIDAALDFKNVSIIANYLKERTTNAQFVVVSLRNNMFELADRLVGIFKLKDCTSTLSIDPSLMGGSSFPGV